MSDQGHYSIGLDKTPANFVPLSPLSFLERSAAVYPNLHQRGVRRPRLHLGPDLRALPAFCVVPGEARHRPRRYGRGDAAEHSRDERGAFRGADDRRGAQHPEHPPRSEYHRLPARPWRRQDHPGRSGIYRRDFRSAGADDGPEACCHRRRRRGFCRRKADRRTRIRRRRVARRSRTSPQGRRRTNGTPSRSATPPEPPAIPRASLPTTAAPISTPSATSSPAISASIRSICGRCRCFTATAGAFPGPSRQRPASTSACARSTRRKSSS